MSNIKQNPYMENTETELKSHLETDIEGAKQAVKYFESMLKAHEAIGELVQSQYDFAVEKLNSFTQTSIKHEE